MRVIIEKKGRGFEVSIQGGNKINQPSVYLNTEVLKMLEEVGKEIAEARIKVQWN